MLLNCLRARYTSALHKKAKTNLRAKKKEAIVNNLSKLSEWQAEVRVGGENTSDSERGASEVAEHPVGLGQTQTATCTIFLKRRKPLRGVLKHSVNHLSYLTPLFRALNLPPAPFTRAVFLNCYAA